MDNQCSKLRANDVIKIIPAPEVVEALWMFRWHFQVNRFMEMLIRSEPYHVGFDNAAQGDSLESSSLQRVIQQLDSL